VFMVNKGMLSSLNKGKNGKFHGHNSWTGGTNKVSKMRHIRRKFGSNFLSFGAPYN
jgi:hypothetical protein